MPVKVEHPVKTRSKKLTFIQQNIKLVKRLGKRRNSATKGCLRRPLTTVVTPKVNSNLLLLKRKSRKR